MTLQEKAAKMQKEAAEIVAAAYKNNPGYGEFIKPLSQKKNIGSQQNPMWVEIEIPYMTVDGRIKQLVDDHVREGGSFSISPVAFEQGPDGTLLARVTVTSRRGTASGISKVGIGGTGVDARNPYENAETSAIGRALGFLGYGLLGGGIASYEEVKGAIEAKEEAKPSMFGKATTHQVEQVVEQVNTFSASEKKATAEVRALSAAQANAIRNMAKKLGVKENVEGVINDLDFKSAAALISDLSKGDTKVFTKGAEHLEAA